MSLWVPSLPFTTVTWDLEEAWEQQGAERFPGLSDALWVAPWTQKGSVKATGAWCGSLGPTLGSEGPACRSLVSSPPSPVTPIHPGELHSLD